MSPRNRFPSVYVDKSVIEIILKEKDLGKAVKNYFQKANIMYLISWICSKCKKIKQFKYTKTDLVEKITKFNEILCDECIDKIKKEEGQKKWNRQKEIEVEARALILNPLRTTATSKYKERFLISNNEIYDKRFEENWRLLNSGFDVDWGVIHKYICEMKYNEFLNTLYWKLIRWKVIQKYKGLCATCAIENNLEVHHRRYSKIHGYELQYWESELIPLCKNCHEAITNVKNINNS